MRGPFQAASSEEKDRTLQIRQRRFKRIQNSAHSCPPSPRGPRPDSRARPHAAPSRRNTLPRPSVPATYVSVSKLSPSPRISRLHPSTEPSYQPTISRQSKTHLNNLTKSANPPTFCRSPGSTGLVMSLVSGRFRCSKRSSSSSGWSYAREYRPVTGEYVNVPPTLLWDAARAMPPGDLSTAAAPEAEAEAEPRVAYCDS